MATEINDVKKVVSDIEAKTASGLPIPINTVKKSALGILFKREITKNGDSLKEYCNEFFNFCEFLGDDSLSILKTHLINISSIIDNINQKNEISISEYEVTMRGLFKSIQSLPSIKSFTFYNSDKINISSIRRLINYIEDKFGTYSAFNIEDILSKSSQEELSEIIDAFISIHNAYINNYGAETTTKSLIKAYNILQSVVHKIKKIELNESIELLEDTSIKIKEKVGLTSNSSLFTAFSDEADSFTWKIISYNIVIILTLLSTLGFLSILIFKMIFDPKFQFIKDYHFYGFYFSFFIFLSIFLAYLIKERSRLITHQYYCKVTYLELIALIPFTGQINDNTKVDDLKIRLAERYFLGPNRSLNNTDPTESITTSKLSEIIKLVQDVKSTIK